MTDSSSSPSPKLRVLGLALYGPQAASHRVRLSQFQNGLSQYGIQLDVQSLLCNSYILRRFNGQYPLLHQLVHSYFSRIRILSSAEKYDIAIVQGELFPFLPYCFEEFFLNLPYIYDFDDAFYLKYRSGRLRFLQPFLGSKFDYFIHSASSVFAGNSYLAEYAKALNSSVHVIPSVVDTLKLCPCRPSNSLSTNNQITIGWVGSPSTSPYLQALIMPLSSLSREISVRFIVMGAVAPSIPGVQVDNLPWTLDTESRLINEFDIGVMPLPNSDWARGKCAYKLIQYMSCGVPVIASRIGTNIDVVPSDCGFLVSSPEEWINAFRELAMNPQLRIRMGMAGRSFVQRRYSLSSTLPRFAQLLSLASQSNCNGSV